MDLRLKHSFRLAVLGPSNCGKTSTVIFLIKNRKQIINHPVAQVIYFYRTWQDNFQDLKENFYVKFLDQTPTYELFQQLTLPFKHNGGSLIIFDDALNHINSDFEKIFTEGAHHFNASVIFLAQKMFSQNETFKTILNNTEYLIIMRNPRNIQTVEFLGRQMMQPGLVNIYQRATKCKFSYLFIDNHPTTHETSRFRNSLLPNQQSFLTTYTTE